MIAMIKLRGRSLVERYGLKEAADRIADMFDIDCMSAVVRALEDFVSEEQVEDEPACAEEEEFEGFESDEARKVNDEEEDEGCESSSDHGPELVEYLRSGMVTVVPAHLVDDDLDDGKPPMRLRRLDNGELLRASRHRVLRGADRRGVYEVDGEESVADARGPRRQTGTLGGGAAILGDWRVPRARLQTSVLQSLGSARGLRRLLPIRLRSLAPSMVRRRMRLISLPTGVQCGLMAAIVLAHGRVLSGMGSRLATTARACLSSRMSLGLRVARAHDRCSVRWLWVRVQVAWVVMSIPTMMRRACLW